MVDNIIAIFFIVIVGYFAFMTFLISEEEKKERKGERDENRK